MDIKQITLKLKKKFSRCAHSDGASQDDIYELSSSRNIFVDSIDDLTADDFAPPPPPPSVRDKAMEWVRRIVMLACACVFIGSAATLVRSFVDYQRGDELYGGIADSIFDSDLSGEHAVSLSPTSRQSPAMLDYYTSLTEEASDILSSESGSYNVKFEQMKANLTYLKTVNPDIIGYIHIEDTRISFPIVQGDDNEYYLNHAYNNEYMVCGSIFADCYIDSKIQNNRNTVLYGHNMLDGNMFNNVMLFFDEAVFNSKLIEIYTFDGIYTFKPFAVFEALATYQYFRAHFTSDEDFVAFCEEMQKKSEVKSDATFTGEDKIITLSTCVETGHQLYGIGRYALHAKLIKVEK